MAASEASLIQRPWTPDRALLMTASAEASPWLAIESFEDNLGRAHLWELQVGTQRALAAVRGIELSGGRLLEVAGLRSLGDRLTADSLQLLDTLARDVYRADLLSMTTFHAHLVRGCLRAGWSPRVATTMVKPLKVH